MTDNEIIKILKCCKKGDCYRCPAHKFGGRCTDKAKWMAIDLIKRQINLIKRKKAEIERLKENNNAIMRTMADAHTEAIKRFAEIIVSDYPETTYYIDNLIKEMVGEG